MCEYSNPYLLPLTALTGVTLEQVQREVAFRQEQLVTRSGKLVDERRETCWMADDGVGGFAYRCVLKPLRRRTYVIACTLLARVVY